MIRPGRPACRRPVRVMMLAVVAASCAFPKPVDDDQQASLGQNVSIVQLDLVDTSRPTAAAPGVPASSSRALPTTVYLPSGVAAAPLIVLAHGAAGAPERFTDLASHWAAHGYVVATPRFPLTNDQVPAPVLADLPEQARDVRFVIDEVRSHSGGTGELAGRVDPERLGLFGLSLGSLTVWTEVFDDPPDMRVDALIQSDGTTLVADERIGAVELPVFVAHSDVDPIFPYADVLARYDTLPGPKFLLTMHGAAHAAVGEDTDTPADDIYRQATTVFWNRTLGARPDEPFPPSVPGVASFVEGQRVNDSLLPGTR